MSVRLIFWKLPIYDLREGAVRSSSRRVFGVAYRFPNLIQRFPLRHQLLHLCAPLCIPRQSFLHVGFGLQVSVSRDESAGIEARDSLGTLDPSFRRSILFQ